MLRATIRGYFVIANGAMKTGGTWENSAAGVEKGSCSAYATPAPAMSGAGVIRSSR